MVQKYSGKKRHHHDHLQRNKGGHKTVVSLLRVAVGECTCKNPLTKGRGFNERKETNQYKNGIKNVTPEKRQVWYSEPRDFGAVE